METKTTSDGLATSLLKLFTDFIESRLETENVELLRRIVDEFLRTPREYETAHTMVRMSFPMVTILPMDRSDTSKLEYAYQVLTGMRNRTAPDQDDALLFREFHDSLQPKINLANWNWLQQIYDEFCAGNENQLADFVAAQRQAISIVPVRPIPQFQPKRCGLPPASRLLCRRDPIKNESDDECGVTCKVTTAALDKKHGIPRTHYPPSVAISSLILQNRVVLLAELRAVEAQAPWTVLSTVPNIELPSHSRDHKRLETALTRFWHTHSRAVWERNFWYRFPFHDVAFKQEQHDRCLRQDRAARFFETNVLVPCYNAFGAQFFVDLDAHQERVPWWWYRQPIVDIVRLCDREGLEASVAYVLSQSRERFPTNPSGYELHYERHFADGRTMWSSRDKYQHMTDEIDALKRRAAL